MEIEMKIEVGAKVRITGDHPHAGEEGVLTKGTAEGVGFLVHLVSLKDCPHLDDGCFAEEDNIEEIVN